MSSTSDYEPLQHFKKYEILIKPSKIFKNNEVGSNEEEVNYPISGETSTMLKENEKSMETERDELRSDGTTRMKRQIGLISGIAMIIGTIIGSGIFITPTVIFQRVDGSVMMTLIIWIGAGVLSILNGLTYCELGTFLPRSGGDHAYLMAAFQPLHYFWGEYPAFVFAFITIILRRPASMAITCLSCSQYFIIPILNGLRISHTWKKNNQDYNTLHKLLAVSCALLLGFMNIYSAKLSSRIQILFTVTKLSACGLIIGIGVFNLSNGEFGSLTSGFDISENTSYSKVALAIYSGIYSYAGGNTLNYVAEEVINPSRTIPLAICISVPLVITLFLFMNLSYLTVFSKIELMSKDPVGIRLGDRMLGNFTFIIPILIALSVYGTANSSQYIAGRIAYVAARDGHFVKVLSYVQINRLTPSVAISLNTFISIIFILSNEIKQIMDSYSMSGVIFDSLNLIGFFILRYTKPEAVRPFRVPTVVPAVGLLVMLYLVIAPIVDSPGIEHIYPFILCGIGLFIYYPFVYKKYFFDFIGTMTRFIQKIILVAPSPYKSD